MFHGYRKIKKKKIVIKRIVKQIVDDIMGHKILWVLKKIGFLNEFILTVNTIKVITKIYVFVNTIEEKIE